MLLRTDSGVAPWIVVEGDSKRLIAEPAVQAATKRLTQLADEIRLCLADRPAKTDIVGRRGQASQQRGADVARCTGDGDPHEVSFVALRS